MKPTAKEVYYCTSNKISRTTTMVTSAAQEVQRCPCNDDNGTRAVTMTTSSVSGIHLRANPACIAHSCLRTSPPPNCPETSRKKGARIDRSQSIRTGHRWIYVWDICFVKRPVQVRQILIDQFLKLLKRIALYGDQSFELLCVLRPGSRAVALQNE
jgi:hypothetical protein